MRQPTLPRFVLASIGFAAFCLTVTGVKGGIDAQSATTSAYLQTLDMARFERNGTRFTAADLSPYRILPSLTDRDVVYHYDFARLAAVERRLQGVDRGAALRAIFTRVTAGAGSHRDRQLAVLTFLHKASFHNLIQPMQPDGQPVFDPLVLLELGEMRCGQVNRVALDLFAAAGYRGRLVQTGFHVLAEIWYDGDWHYFDGDIFGNGDSARWSDGSIPSVQKLSERPELVDALASFWEPDHCNSVRPQGTNYPSYFYFGRTAYRDSGVEPGFIYKRATRAQEAQSPLYGWEHFAIVPDLSRRLFAGPGPRRTPAPPRLAGVHCVDTPIGRHISLHWQGDPGAAGYRVFVGSASRGWNYDGASLPPALMKWKSSNGGWRPEHYAARFRLPPRDLAHVETNGCAATLTLAAGTPCYITVMAYDAYGAALGRVLYPMSEELFVP